MLVATSTRADYVSTEFLRFGKTLTAQKPPVPPVKLRRYQEAIAQVNGPTTCSIRVVHGEIDVGKGLDWSKIQDLVDLEICLFYAAAELQNVDLLRDFLTSSGFRTSLPMKEEANVSRWKGINGEGLVLTGSMSIAQLPRGFGGFFGTLGAYGLGVGVSLDQAGRPYHTQAALNRN